jgi:hypothetical protein
MLDYMNQIPEFYLENDNVDLMSTTVEFHDRILEFVEQNLNGEINEIDLCTFVTMDGTTMIAKLPRSAYKQSIEKSMEFFIEVEDYEKCNKIKKLLKQL